MAGTRLKSWVLFGLTAAALAGCAPGTSGSGGADEPIADLSAADGAASATTATVASATTAKLIDHDVEAPDVFQTTDKALWDGRPSLGGVWVATADAKDPERVILRNPSNGKFVIGALFRREADNPGPKLQISSDAADALGILAGAPITLNVTALRRQEAPAATDASKPILDAAETVQTSTDQVTAAASAAIDKATKDPATKDPVIPTAPAIPPAPGKPAAKPAELAADAVATLPEPTVATKPARTGPSPAPTPRVLGKTSAQPATQVAILPVAAAPTVIAPIATAPVASPTPASGASIQIGIFSVEDNANRAVKSLAKSGISATIRREESHGKPLWSVIATGSSATLAKIKAAGFADAYVLKR